MNSKIRYSHSFLIAVRDRLFPAEYGAAVTEECPTEPPPLPLPTFSGTPVSHSELPNAPGSNLREALFGASSHAKPGSTRRQSSGSSFASVPQEGGISASSHTSGLWVYRTKIGSKKPSNAMALKDIQQLVLDELVLEDEIELRAFDGSAPSPHGTFIPLKEALLQAEAASSMVSVSGGNASQPATDPSQPGTYAAPNHPPLHHHNPSNAPTSGTATSERWRPSAQRTSAANPRTHNTVPTSATQGRGAMSLPSRMLNLSREDMMTADDLQKRPSPSAASTPPHSSPTAALLQLAPIGEVDAAGSQAYVTPPPPPPPPLDDYGLGAVPQMTGSAAPRPPMALDVDDSTIHVPGYHRHHTGPTPTAPAGLQQQQQSSGPASMSSSLTHLAVSPGRMPPPPISSVDDMAVCSPTLFTDEAASTGDVPPSATETEAVTQPSPVVEAEKKKSAPKRRKNKSHLVAEEEADTANLPSGSGDACGTAGKPTEKPPTQAAPGNPWNATAAPPSQGPDSTTNVAAGGQNAVLYPTLEDVASGVVPKSHGPKEQPTMAVVLGAKLGAGNGANQSSAKSSVKAKGK